jgi:hypothetical protein
MDGAAVGVRKQMRVGRWCAGGVLLQGHSSDVAASAQRWRTGSEVYSYGHSQMVRSRLCQSQSEAAVDKRLRPRLGTLGAMTKFRAAAQQLC